MKQSSLRKLGSKGLFGLFIFHLPQAYVPMKSETEKERKAREEIREKLSPPLDPAVVSAGSWGPPVVGVRQGSCPFFFYSLQVPVLIASRKFSKWVSECVCVGGLGGLTTSPHNAHCLAQVLSFLAYVTSLRERGGFRKPAPCLPRVLLVFHTPLSRQGSSKSTMPDLGVCLICVSLDRFLKMYVCDNCPLWPGAAY